MKNKTPKYGYKSHILVVQCRWTPMLFSSPFECSWRRPCHFRIRHIRIRIRHVIYLNVFFCNWPILSLGSDRKARRHFTYTRWTDDAGMFAHVMRVLQVPIYLPTSVRHHPTELLQIPSGIEAGMDAEVYIWRLCSKMQECVCFGKCLSQI